ncbi:MULTISPECIES: Hsp70 family protein [unclassified Coleofasciculus]|uniref:Hsp70 family protein n=1 Tax=unclassified Coleofasciculus TaxID=2692782 RepID=UPI0018819274|nr:MULTISPECIES: Hsp70 family protein [unclassified Coleofasciculus]MBE9128974.1 Hsp70 family protein [Coleofasciculus sp. LEGE 07081]MBE9148972.1 Hsp70 family protein [Coleofasciculus sp. LEGE 07092]
MTTVAIDFGTSNTVVSILEPDTNAPKTLRLGSLSRLFKVSGAEGEAQDIPVIPTLVFVKEPGKILLGEQVRSQRLGQSQPTRFFKAFKRDLAADFQPPPRLLDGHRYSAESISEEFINSIWQQLQVQRIQPSQLIFTVPVGAFERYLDWFRDIASRLDVSSVQLIDESTAAALGYAVQRPSSLVLVVDFGGGTLDLSLVRTAPQQYRGKSDRQTVLKAEVLAKSDAYVGGEDVDIWIVEEYLHKQGLSRAEIGEIGWQNLLEIAERLKIRLSRAEEAKESWLEEETFTSYDLELSRDGLEEILENRQFLEQLRNTVDEVLGVAHGKGIDKRDIEQVLLVGGSCLIPAVQQLMTSYFGRTKVKLDKPFEAVAHGALALSQFAGVDDYLRHGYAIRLWEPHGRRYSYFPLFEKGIQYPCQRAEPLILQVATEAQGEIRLDIGEVAEMAQAEVVYDAQGRMTSSQLYKHADYRSLESHHEQVCIAHLDPPGQVGVDRVAVQFEVDERRMLLATVRDLLTERLLVEKGAIAKLQ